MVEVGESRFDVRQRARRRSGAGGGVAASGSRLVGCDRDDGYRPRRLSLVGVVAVAILCVDECPQTLVAGIRRGDDCGRGPSTLPPNLNLDIWVRPDVVQPRRRAIGATIRGDDKVRVAVPGVNQAVGSSCTGSTTRRAKQERRNTNHPMAEPSVGSLVQLLMDAKHLTREAHDIAAYGTGQ